MTTTIRNTFFGFTDNKKPMQKAKMETTLNKLIRYDNKLYWEKEFVLNMIIEGYTPAYEENYTYYSKKLDGYTKPKTRYILKNNEGSSFDVSKTVYDFALYLIEKKIDNMEIALEFAKNEEMETLAKEQKEEQEKIKLQEDQARKRELEKEERQKVQQEKMKQWKEIGLQLITDEHKEIVSNVVVEMWEEISNRTEQPIEEFTGALIDRTIQNIGNSAYMLHNVAYLVHDDESNNLMNKIDKAIYIRIFDVLDNDPKITITSKIKAFYEGREYKGNRPTIMHTFYTYTKDGYEAKQGEKKTIEGYECYIEKVNETYNIVEAKTGLKVISNYSNKKEALKKVTELISNKKDQLERSIANHINKNGLSPLFIEQEAI